MNLRIIERLIRRFAKETQGNAITEYAICLALIVLASILAVTSLGVAMSELFPDLASLVN